MQLWGRSIRRVAPRWNAVDLEDGAGFCHAMCPSEEEPTASTAL